MGPRLRREKDPTLQWIYGRHAVEETIRARSCRIFTVFLLIDERAALEPLAREAQRAGARVEWVGRGELDRVSGGGRHQGLAAKVAEKPGRGLAEFINGLSPEEKSRALFVALDQIQDPQNFGAILRSAACLGAAAVLYPERRAAPLSQAVLSASAGAAQRLPAFKIGNLAQTLTRLKEAGFWVYGADMGGRPCWEIALNRPLVLVIGSEGAGLRPLVKSLCDERVAVPQSAGGVASLNASAAAAVLLYEAARQAGSPRSDG